MSSSNGVDRRPLCYSIGYTLAQKVLHRSQPQPPLLLRKGPAKKVALLGLSVLKLKLLVNAIGDAAMSMKNIRTLPEWLINFVSLYHEPFGADLFVIILPMPTLEGLLHFNVATIPCYRK